MNYQSTRDNTISMSSAEAIKIGLSREGGLFVPESIPELTLEDLVFLSEKSYNDRARFVLSRFLTDFSDEELSACVENAYGNQTFENDFVAPLKKLDDHTHIMELWHGPTCAFKDVALQILPHFLTTSLRKTGETKEAVILVATSGDTGKAALEGFCDVKGTSIIVFFPKDGVSQIQRLQMVTQKGENVLVSGVNGNFDDAQSGVKKIFTDKNFAKEIEGKGYFLSSANSINWGRLVPQIVYYVSAYCDLIRSKEIKVGEKVNFVVPTGNFGNILAAYFAKEMGVPVHKLICASNRNRVLTDFIETGIYRKDRPFYLTTSPSMDILISSNLERLLYLLSGRDAAKTAEYMSLLNTVGEYTVDSELLEKIQGVFYAGCCDDVSAAAEIKSTFDENTYVCDTHTAVGKRVYREYVEKTGDTTLTVIASTASPYKFASSVLDALEVEKADGEFEQLEQLERISGLRIPASLADLKSLSVRFADYCEKDAMIDLVDGYLK